jgi:hypothetical protein
MQHTMPGILRVSRSVPGAMSMAGTLLFGGLDDAEPYGPLRSEEFGA